MNEPSEYSRGAEALRSRATMTSAPLLRVEGLTRVFRETPPENNDDRPFWKRWFGLGTSMTDDESIDEFGQDHLADGGVDPDAASFQLRSAQPIELCAVNNVSFALDPGRLVAIFGRSGSGKTTLLNLLCGLDQPTSGEIYFDAEEMTHASARGWAALRRKRIGFVFQRFLLHGQRSALENTLMPLLLAGHTPDEAREMATDALFAVGLGNRLTTPASKLSGGQCQRIAIARAIAGRPQLILADEPTGNLDAVTACDILELLLQLRDELNLTLLITTHDDLIREVADEIRVMDDGRLTLED